MFSLIAGVFSADPATADIFLVVAWLMLWIVGAIAIFQKALTLGLGLVAIGFIPLASLFLTP